MITALIAADGDGDGQSTLELWSDAIWAAKWVLLLWLLISLAAGALIARRAGYSPYLGLIAVLTPVLGPLMVLAFALWKWPVARERDKAFALLEKNGIDLPVAKEEAAS